MAAPYTLRSRGEPMVSAPVTWEEVAEYRVPGRLESRAPDIPPRLQDYGDLMAPLLDHERARGLP